MKVTKTGFDGLMVIEADVFSDSRGYFLEAYNKQRFAAAGVPFECIQENHSFSRRGVIRGLHYQSPPNAQAKLIRVLAGQILDVVVDLRSSKTTFKRVFSIELSSADKRQLLIPRGFAHGFSVLSESAEVSYLCDEFYNYESEKGILYNDPSLAIDWKVDLPNRIVSIKDQGLPALAEASFHF